VGNPEQFLKLLLQSEGDIRAFIGAIVPDRHIGDDVFQEVVLALWRDKDSYDPARSFGAWARGVAARKILQQKSQDARFPVAFAPETIQAVLDAYDRTEENSSRKADALRECVRELPEKSRQILVFRYEEELSCQEIAIKTGRTMDAIYQLLSRIRAQLEECIRRRLGRRGEAV